MTNTTTKTDWGPWHKERHAFFQRETEGFIPDLKALETHIKKLTEICPKDAGGWPVYQALDMIDNLTADYNRAMRYLKMLTG